MEMVVTVSQLVVALGLLNVWLLRTGKQTSWRGGDAKSMREEFLAYGLPVWFMWVVGTLKVSLAILLIVGLWKNYLTQPAAIGIAVLMLGAIAMHFKVGDPLKKSLPAISVLLLTLVTIVV
ncbi:MAG: DoxX family membrane protein [Acidobacteria bacterium]|nr:DoxX family membrane protein [Acidobacteriota bacterium]